MGVKFLAILQLNINKERWIRHDRLRPMTDTDHKLRSFGRLAIEYRNERINHKDQFNNTALCHYTNKLQVDFDSLNYFGVLLVGKIARENSCSTISICFQNI